MNQILQWIVYKGKRTLIVDYTNLNEAEILQAIEDTKQEFLRLPAGTRADSITIMANTRTTSAISTKAKEMLQATRDRQGHAAVVGLGGFQKAIAQLINRDFYIADSVEDAKEWLARQVS